MRIWGLGEFARCKSPYYYYYLLITWFTGVETIKRQTKRCLATVSNNCCLWSQMADSKCTHAHWCQREMAQLYL